MATLLHVCLFYLNDMSWHLCLQRNKKVKVLVDILIFWRNASKKQHILSINFVLFSGVLSHKMEVHSVRLHFEMTGDGNHNVLLLPGALGKKFTSEKYTDWSGSLLLRGLYMPSRFPVIFTREGTSRPLMISFHTPIPFWRRGLL